MSGSLDPMDCSPPGSSVHGILQARILEWVAMPSSRSLPDPGIEPRSLALQADSLPLSHLGNLIYSPKYMKQNLPELKGNDNSVRLVGHFSPWLSITDRTTSQKINKEIEYMNVRASQGGASGKELTCQCRRIQRLRFNPWVGKTPPEKSNTHSGILAWKIPWTKELGKLTSIGSQRVRHD